MPTPITINIPLSEICDRPCDKPCVIFQFPGGTKYRVCEGSWCKKRQHAVKVTVEVSHE